MKSFDDYSKRVASKDGLQHKCKDCCAENAKSRDYRLMYSSYNKEYAIKKKYNLTLEEYHNILSKGCTVCRSKEKLVLDHCHKTKRVRGCLCHKCNTALGLLDDDVDKILALHEYLCSTSKRINGPF